MSNDTCREAIRTGPGRPTGQVCHPAWTMSDARMSRSRARRKGSVGIYTLMRTRRGRQRAGERIITPCRLERELDT
jgi:hypothetical protein